MVVACWGSRAGAVARPTSLPPKRIRTAAPNLTFLTVTVTGEPTAPLVGGEVSDVAVLVPPAVVEVLP